MNHDMYHIYNDAQDYDNSVSNVPREEMVLVNGFIEKFIFVQIGSTSKTDIDIKLALKSLPIKISSHNLDRVEMINFHTL